VHGLNSGWRNGRGWRNRRNGRLAVSRGSPQARTPAGLLWRLKAVLQNVADNSRFPPPGTRPAPARRLTALHLVDDNVSQ